MLVAPLAGAWIEICRIIPYSAEKQSLPLRERGLKYFSGIIKINLSVVAPLAGAWIEITR